MTRTVSCRQVKRTNSQPSIVYLVLQGYLVPGSIVWNFHRSNTIICCNTIEQFDQSLLEPKFLVLHFVTAVTNADTNSELVLIITHRTNQLSSVIGNFSVRLVPHHVFRALFAFHSVVPGTVPTEPFGRFKWPLRLAYTLIRTSQKFSKTFDAKLRLPNWHCRNGLQMTLNGPVTNR